MLVNKLPEDYLLIKPTEKLGMSDEQHSHIQDESFFLNALFELENILLGDGDFNTICTKFLEQLMGTLLVSKGGILLLDPNSYELKLHLHSGLPQDQLAVEVTQSLFETMVMQGEEIYIIENPPAQLTHFFQKNDNKLKILDSHIWVPLFLRGSVFGFISLGKKYMDQEYTANDLKILNITARIIALSFQNQVLFDSMRRQQTDQTKLTREIQAIQAMSFVLKIIPGLDELLDTVLTQALKLLNVQSGLIFQIQPHNPLLKVAVSEGISDENLQNSRVSRNNSALLTCFQHRRGVILNNHNDRRLNKLTKADHLLAAPIFSGKELFAIIVMAERDAAFEKEQYEELDLQLLSLLCRQAGLAIENYNSYQDVSKHAHRQQFLIDNMATGILTTTVLGEIDSVNDAMLSLLSCEKEDILNSHFHTIFSEDPHILDLIQQAQISEKSLHEHFTICHAISHDTPVNISASPLRNGDNNVHGVVVTLDEVRNENNLKEIFRNKVHSEALHELVEGEIPVKLDGAAGKATILYCQMNNLPEIIEALNADATFRYVNHFLEKANRIILDAKGMWNKTDPEAMMAAFGMPFTRDDDAERALRTAIEIMAMVTAENELLEQQGIPLLDVSIGVATGEVVAGGAGASVKNQYLVLGDTVSISRHLCETAKADEILVCPSTRGRLQGNFKFDRLRKTRVRQLGTQIEIYRYSGEKQ